MANSDETQIGGFELLGLRQGPIRFKKKYIFLKNKIVVFLDNLIFWSPYSLRKYV